MRQVVEKRLAAIVEQDKLTREIQWQRQLVSTVMQYAWTGRFDEARQVAKHPALSAELQTELLAKIELVQMEQQPPIAGQPATPASNQSHRPATASGRDVPGISGYTSGRVLPYTAVSLGQQCPTPDAKPSAKPSKPAAQSTATAKRTTSEIPALVPALSQNLASRLVRLSQMPAAIQTPAQFAGIVSQLRVAPAAQPANPETRLVAQAQQLAPVTQTVTQPITQPVASRQQVALASPTAERLAASQATSQATNQATSQASTQILTQTSTGLPGFWSLDQILGAAIDQSLEQFSFGLPDWIAKPLSASWWSSPIAQSSPAAERIASLNLEPLEQSLTDPQRGSSIQLGREQLGRDMRKLSSLTLPALAKPAPLQATAPAQPVLYNAAALLAMNCTQSSLTHYSGDQMIDPASSKQMGWVNLSFPLPVAAVLTSAFGWRIHPISGTLSFHTGMDLGAPMGTPVLAAATGRVVAADEMGGYGLTVVVEASNQRNLYAHLSGIAVQPGAQVQQGTILGWVGSTGNSTGPHLHFESQVATSSGWTTVDPIASATLAAVQP
jgi:murein DD-endopeptidase MepM/ murein hydrolase activator NlpD